ncbi:MAG TPA: phospholipase D-like domain-containing protein [Polyangiaceae bacterium]|jgi:phospholipase D1/2
MGKAQNKSAAAQAYATYMERKGNRVDLYELGSDDAVGNPQKSSLRDVADAIRGAKKFIFICDWSFQPYMRLPPRSGSPTIDQTVGAVLNSRAIAGALVAIHVWDHVNMAAPDDYNDSGNDWLDKIAQQTMSRPTRDKNLLWRSSSRTGVGNSFHQKYVILDFADPVTGKRVIKAFFGGLDLTKGRFAWGKHVIGKRPVSGQPNGNMTGPFAPVQGLDLSAVASGNSTFFVDDWYNAEFTECSKPGDPTVPRQSWQDYYASIIGPAAWDLAREFVGRFNSDNGSFMSGPSGNTSDQDKDAVQDKFKSLFSDGEMLKEWEDHQGPFVARVVRSIESVDWTQHKITHHFKKDEVVECNTPTADGKTQTEFKWKLSNTTFEKSIEQSYVYAISLADRFIYIETQYFIGSGSQWGRGSVGNGIPQAIVERILLKITQGQDFHAYIVIPQFPEGNAVGTATPAQRLFEWNTMRYMAQTVAREAKKKGKDWKDYLSFYFLMNWTAPDPTPHLTGKRKERVQANWRYMVYVHSKLMIVDDEYLIVGSANLNERSLAGDRDTEICVYIKADEGKLAECKEKIQALRVKAWTDHMGVLPPSADNPQQKACYSAVQMQGRANWAVISEGMPPNGSHLVAFPFAADESTFAVESLSTTPAIKGQDPFIFDAPAKAAKPAGNGTIPDSKWGWGVPDGTNLTLYGHLAE